LRTALRNDVASSNVTVVPTVVMVADLRDATFARPHQPLLVQEKRQQRTARALVGRVRGSFDLLARSPVSDAAHHAAIDVALRDYIQELPEPKLWDELSLFARYSDID
jgi:hypothetical protein